MEIDKFQFISHLLFFGDLIGSFNDLGWKGRLFVFVFLYEGSLLTVFLLKKLLNSLGFNITCSAVFSSH